MRTPEEVLKSAELDASVLEETGIKYRYTCWKNDMKREEFTGGGEECRFLASNVVHMMKKHKMNIEEAECVVGYVIRLLRIDNEYTPAIDVESIYVKYVLNDELIDLSKRIAKYIETQEEVYVHIPTALDKVYEFLVARSKEVTLWWPQ